MIKRQLRHALILSISLSLAASTVPALAQATALVEEDIVITARRIAQTGMALAGNVGVLGNKLAQDVPFAIKSYNEALILNQQPLTLGQVLENDPSVRTGYGFGNAAETFVIRGFALAGDDVGFDGLYGITPRQLIAPELYESVQVLNGASAFLNGAAPGGSGIGGSVNLIPKRAGRDPLTRVTANYTAAAHMGGSFDVSRRFGASKSWGVRFNGAIRRGDVSIDDEYRSAHLLGGALSYASGALHLSLDLAFQEMRVNRLRPKLTVPAAISVVPEVPKADANYGQPYQFTELRDLYGQFRAEYQLSDAILAYAALGARDGSEDGFYSTLTLTNATAGSATVSGSLIPRTDNNEAAQVGLRGQVTTGRITHELNAGGSINWLVNRNAFEFYAVSPMLNNIYAPVAVTQPRTVTFRGGNMADPFPISRIRLMSAFASDTLGLWDERLLATIGLRLQQISTKSYSNITRAQTGAYKKDAVTPALGLVIKPAESLSLYANRIEALVQGASAPAASGGIPVSNAGEILPPIKSTQYELGAKATLISLSGGLSFFQIERATAILVADAGGATLRFGPFGIQRNRGVEFTMAGEFATGLRMIGGGSILDAQLRRTASGLNEGNRAVGVPEYLVNLDVEWDVPVMPALTVTGRIVHTGQQPSNLGNTLFLPAWTRLNVGARYVAVVGKKPLTLRFGIDNVADKRYWATAFDTFRPDLLQGGPRTFRLSLSTDL